MKFKTRFAVLFAAIALLTPILMAPTLFTGCAGTPNRIAYQGAVIQRTSVEVALGLFNEWVGLQKAKGIDTTATQVKVEAAFNKWKDATIAALQVARLNAVATTTNAAGQTGVSSAFQDALNNAAALKADFFQVLLDIGIQLPGTSAATTFSPVK